MSNTGQAKATLGRHSAYYLLGRVAAGGVGLLALAAFTRVLSPADYGRYAVLVAVAALISSGGFQWLRQCLIRFGTGAAAENTRQPLLGTLGVLFAVLLVATLVVAGVAWLLSRVGWVPLKLAPMEIVAVCALAWSTAWFELAADARRADLDPWRYSAATFLRALLNLVLGVVAALLTHNVIDVVVAVAAGYLLSSMVAMPYWLSGLLQFRQARWQQARNLMHYGLPLCVTLSMTFVLDTIDRLMLAAMRGVTEAGVYASAYNLAQFSIGTVLAGLALGSLPLAVAAFKNGDRKAAESLLERNLLLGLALALPAAVGLSVLAPALGRLLLGNYVAGESAIVIVIISIGISLAALRSYCVDVVFMLEQRTWLQSLVVGGAALLNAGLNYWWIPRWGTTGAATATLVSYAAAYVGSSVLSRRYMRIHVDLRQLSGIALACGAMAVPLCMLSSDDAGWLRTVAAIAAGAALYGGLAFMLNLAGIRALLAARPTVSTR